MKANLTRWRAAVAVYGQRSMLHMLIFGFSCGLPYMLVFATLSFWLREAEVSRSAIGYFSWILVVYGMKWLWAPLVDRLKLPLLHRLLGRRRSWIGLAQTAIALSLLGLAWLDPALSLQNFALCTLLVAWFSATQDIAIDAYRIEIAPQEEQGSLAAAYMLGYRLAMILSGAGALYLAAWFSTGEGYDPVGWSHAYIVMAGIMGLCLLNTLLSQEPVQSSASIEKDEEDAALALERTAHLPLPIQRMLSWCYGALLCPFIDFFRRYRWQAFWLLLLIGTYRISDIFMGVMANPFYVDLGYSKEQVASVAKVFGVIMTLIGTGIGGLLVTRFGCRPILTLGAILVVATNQLFAVMAWLAAALTPECANIACEAPSIYWLMAVISADNISAGIATAAFIAFLSSLTNVAYSATQYALFSSLMVLFPKFLAGFSGVLVDDMGYVWFFTIASLIGLPVLLLIWLTKQTQLAPVNAENNSKLSE
ncbi:MFS transporter [Corallincola holothuriorum]|uniref:MFS transporter n=1 Tax=Corallincola holothuriorum TaxID=2282215 RepID=A0A368NGE6_9GAMM|nr:MFS transporter [Corallincola holothuriorum]RCU49276.1 MFS transporter [Corallincola holothuriorum]